MRRLITQSLRGPIGSFVGLFLLFTAYSIQQPALLSSFGLNTVANQGAALAIVACAQSLVMITGGVDLSLGSIVSLTSSFAATYTAGRDDVTALAILGLTLIAATLCGLLNGVLAAIFKIEPIIVTLATSFLFQGIALLIRPQPGGSCPMWLADAATGSIGWFPNAFLWLALLLLAWFLFKRTLLGWHIFAVGSDERNAFSLGVKTEQTKIIAYGVAGGLSGVCGLFLVALTGSGDPNIGAIYTLNGIAAAVLGGTAFTGGVGGMVGPLFGAYLVSLIVSVIYSFGISPFFQNIVQGSILLVVVIGGALRRFGAKQWSEVLAS
jgi:ribose transport system permease protein